MLRRTLVSDVGGGYFSLAKSLVAAAISGRQCRGALLQIPRLVAVLRCAAYGQRVDAVGVAIAGARVVEAAAVARGPHEYGAEAFAAVQRALLKRLLGERARTIDHLAVVVRAPTSRVNAYVVAVEHKGTRLHRVSHVAVQHTDSLNYI